MLLVGVDNGLMTKFIKYLPDVDTEEADVLAGGIQLVEGPAENKIRK